jgi:adenylate cyclase
MNSGMVTVSEIGKYKKEIAYHGDTLNTAARIQAKCNQYQKELLISEQIMNQLHPNGFCFEKIGSIVLRGKEQETAIYAVEKN